LGEDESVTVKLSLKVPAAVGVPEINPDVETVRPVASPMPDQL
jgi:hypothetical protein